jgi:hypothetical protein
MLLLLQNAHLWRGERKLGLPSPSRAEKGVTQIKAIIALRLQKAHLSIPQTWGNECLVRVSFSGMVSDPSHQIDDQGVEKNAAKIVSRLTSRSLEMAEGVLSDERDDSIKSSFLGRSRTARASVIIFMSSDGISLAKSECH